MWKCPNCETINKEDVCAVCGETRFKPQEIPTEEPPLPVSVGKPESKPEKAEKTGKGKKVAIVLLSIILLSLIGGATYLFLTHKDAKTEPDQELRKGIEKAQTLIAKKEYDECKELVQEMKNKYSEYNNSFDALYIEGYLNMELKDYQEANRCFDKALKVGSSVECLVNNAVCYSKRGLYDEARKMLEANKSDDVSKKYVEAEIADIQERTEDAIEGFEYVIANTQNEYLKKRAYISLANQYVEKRHVDKDEYIYLEKQIKVMEEAMRELKLEDDLTLTEMMGEAYRTSEDYDLAIIKFKRLLELGYERDYIYVNIAQIHQIQGQYEEAKEVLDELNRKFPKNHRCYVAFAFLYIDMETEKPNENRDYSKAFDYYELADKYVPEQQRDELTQLKLMIEKLEKNGWRE